MSYSPELERAMYFEHRLALERWSEVTKILKELNDALASAACAGIEINEIESNFSDMSEWSKYAKPKIQIKKFKGRFLDKALTIKDNRIDD